MDRTRVLIVEDEPLFCELLRRSLTADGTFEVVGVAHDGKAAISIAGEMKPDAVLMDIELNGEIDGIEAAKRIKEENPRTGIVILSAHNDRRYVTSLPLGESHGWAYLLKQTLPDLTTLIRAVEGSIKGMVVLDPAVVHGLKHTQNSAVARLTSRQREVLELIAQGYNNAAIAERLYVTEKSVETHINAIYQELELSGEPDIHARVRATLLYLKNT